MQGDSTCQRAIFQVLEQLKSVHLNRKDVSRPLILLTWAQSLDGKLSTSATAQTAISGSSSMQLTHALRAVHDSILVGSNTVATDNPRLSTRLSPSTETTIQPLLTDFGHSSTACSQNPIPIVLDSRLRTTPIARFIQQRRTRPNASNPLIFCASDTQPDAALLAVADVIPVPKNDATINGLHLKSVLSHLLQRDVRSVMVEGGPTVLSSFLDAGLWDIAIITIAPAVFGAGPALSSSHNRGAFENLRFRNSRWFNFDDDAVLVGFRT